MGEVRIFDVMMSKEELKAALIAHINTIDDILRVAEVAIANKGIADLVRVNTLQKRVDEWVEGEESLDGEQYLVLFGNLYRSRLLVQLGGLK